jgi:L,D-transpeptidase YcbB
VSSVYSQPISRQPVEKIIEHILSSDSNHPNTLGAVFYCRDSLALFYKGKEYRPAWRKHKNTVALLSALRSANLEGLRPQDYHLIELERYFSLRHKSRQDRAYFDLLLTDAYFLYGTHLLRGKINPETLYPGEWETARRNAKLVSLLQDALDEQEITASLEILKPAHASYKKLKSALQFYELIQSESSWPMISEGPPLEPCHTSDQIAQVRKRLHLTGQLTAIAEGDSSFYDSSLFTVVKKFQYQHGLRADGVIGKNTVMALNYLPEQYIQKIKVNLERCRWLPQSWGPRFVWVNIPDFRLSTYENDSIVFTMKIIAGRPDRKTPVFSSRIRYLTLNPTWTVPPTILKEDALPAIQSGQNYLKRNDLRVFNATGEELDPATIAWSQYTAENFPYILRHDPGGSNPLGRMKFQFPNNHLVFLHDTNLPNLFSNSYRALSSGCIRLEQPFALAEYLLKGTGWTKAKLNDLVQKGETTTLTFPTPTPIYLVYFTAFAENGELHFRHDVYGWDEAILKALTN